MFMHLLMHFMPIIGVYYWGRIIKYLCKHNTKTFCDSLHLRFVNFSLTKLVASFTSHFIKPQAKTYLIIFSWIHFIFKSHLFFMSRAIDSEFDFICSKNRSEWVFTILAMKPCFYFSSHKFSSLILIKTIFKETKVKFISILTHLI
jgi:hypothetical protein